MCIYGLCEIIVRRRLHKECVLDSNVIKLQYRLSYSPYSLLSFISEFSSFFFSYVIFLIFSLLLCNFFGSSRISFFSFFVSIVCLFFVSTIFVSLFFAYSLFFYFLFFRFSSFRFSSFFVLSPFLLTFRQKQKIEEGNFFPGSSLFPQQVNHMQIKSQGESSGSLHF